MSADRSETEVKLRFESAAAALDALRPLGLEPRVERTFEDNVLYDREHEPLEPEGRLLRLRRVGPRAVLTYKAPLAEASTKHKVRLEEETVVEDPESLGRILEALGFRPGYRYQKYRTEFALGDLHVCLDETPLGCFVELEGAPDSIDRAAERMGVGPGDYITATYGELHRLHAEERGEEPGDLLMDEGR
jgi:adenylate cyclase class 2